MFMRSIRSNKKRLAVAAAIPVAVVVSGALVWQSTYSAFSATTQNPTNNWASGTVALSDDDSNTAMFAAANLKPGQTGQKCIAVTSTGTLPAAVKLYGTSYAQTKALGANLNLTVEEGTGATFSSCTGFTPIASGSMIYTGTLDGFGTTKTNYASGAGVWTPTGSASETRVYRITYTLSNTTPDTSQGGTAQVGFTWESQNS
ncbi:MAG: CalY family protein [Actinomycetota bacterium]|nr:CalY family protein [Actinomycetota bacterium]